MVQGYKHGLKGTAEYNAWVAMRQRCHNPAGHDKHYYAGITVCSEWNDPLRFVSDMGTKPSIRHQLDRIDNTKGYSKENCRWVERTIQMRNTRSAKFWIVDSVAYDSLTHAAEVFDVSPSRIKAWCEGRTDGGYSYPPKPNCWSEKKYG